MNKIPIVIDCDPGVDDAFSIALAASFEHFDIRAITAVDGNAPLEKTTKNALGLAQTFEIPCRVAQGAPRAMYKKRLERKGSLTHGESGVGTVVWPDFHLSVDPLPAWDVLYDEAVRANRELVLFAVGPLTNIAIALLKYPDLPEYIKRFVIMGGATEKGNVTPFAEANINCDPTAARICFAKLPTYMVGLNVTHAAALTIEDFQAMISACGEGNTPASAVVKELCEFSLKNAFERGTDSNVIHDALAIAAEMDENLIRWNHCYAYVEDNPLSPHQGQTVVDLSHTSGFTPNCHVAVGVEKDRFARMLLAMCRFYREK